jgi:hypothetical protein
MFLGTLRLVFFSGAKRHLFFPAKYGALALLAGYLFFSREVREDREV